MFIKADSQYVIELTKCNSSQLSKNLFTFLKHSLKIGVQNNLKKINNFLKSYITFRKVRNEIYIFLQKYLSSEIIM